ncbi:hypothetical protein SRABI106_04846 [Rahnella aquatilis]|nr:hypothetical protein SRABI106_04846 [Rahnella aquatilis]
MAAGLRDGFRRQRLAQPFGHFIQMLRTLFTVTGDTRLITHPCCQVPDQYADSQHHAESHQILRVSHRQRATGLHEKQIKADDVNHRRQHRRPAAIKQRDNHHAEQIHHHQIGLIERRHQPLRHHGDHRAQRHGQRTAPQLATEAISKRARVLLFAQGRDRCIFQPDDD